MAEGDRNQGAPDLELGSRLADPGGRWRTLPDELAGRPDLSDRVQELEKIAETDRSVDVRYRARKILSALTSGRRRSVVDGTPPALGALAKRLSGLGPEIRAELLEQFVRTHGAAAREELVSLLGSESDPTVLSTAVRLVGTVGTAAHLRVLMPFLAHSSSRVVANTVEAMGRLDSGAALPMVLPVLMAEDHRVRANVLMVLYRWSRKEVLAYLSRMASSTKESYRAAALWCLSQIKDGDAEEILVTMLATEESPDLADAACRLLGETGSRETIPQLYRIVNEHPARAAAAQRVIRAIGQRLELGEAELQALAPGGGRLGRKSLMLNLRLLSRTIRVRLLERRARRARLAASGGDPGRRRWIVPAVAVVIIMGLAILGVSRQPAPVQPAARAIGRPKARVAASRKAPGRPTDARFVGRVTGRYGATLVVQRDYTSYAIRYRNPKALGSIKAGQTIQVTARYLGFNSLEGYVSMDGQSARVVR